MTIVALAPMDLAALLCSRVCHDVISPVGAIVNGLEVLEDEKDPEMREVAIDLIKKSAASASARLQFCRLAFGAAGSIGASDRHRRRRIGDARPHRRRPHHPRLEPAAPVRGQEQGQAAAQPLPDRPIGHPARRRRHRRSQRPGRYARAPGRSQRAQRAARPAASPISSPGGRRAARSTRIRSSRFSPDWSRAIAAWRSRSRQSRRR